MMMGNNNNNGTTEQQNNNNIIGVVSMAIEKSWKSPTENALGHFVEQTGKEACKNSVDDKHDDDASSKYGELTNWLD